MRGEECGGKGEERKDTENQTLVRGGQVVLVVRVRLRQELIKGTVEKEKENEDEYL